MTSKNKSSSAIKKALESTAANLMENIIDNIPQKIYWRGDKSTILGCNKQFADFIGLKDIENINGKKYCEIFEENLAKQLKAIDDDTKKTKKPRTNIKVEQGEEIYEFDSIPMLTPRGRVIGILGILSNITENERNKIKLEKSEEKYRTLIEFTNTSYLILNKKMEIIESNENFKNLFSVKIKGKNPRSWVVQQDINRFDKAFEDVLNGEIIDDLTVDIKIKEKTRRISISANLIENGSNRIFCLIKDVTSRKTKEEAQYIQEQKKKDRIKQNIVKLRSKLKDLKN